MSIANGTTHYNYPQVQLTDRPTFADFNPAFADIDSKLYSLISGASTDHSAIEALQTGLGETNTLLASVKNTADSANGKANTNAENITLLQTGLGNTNRDVANKLYSVAVAEPYDADAGTYALGDIVVYNGQRYKCTTAVAVAEPFDADKWTGEDVETVLEHLQYEIDNIPTGGTAADVTLAPITGMVATNVQDGISELKGMISAGSVSVTADGVKTYGALFDELFALINSSKITNKAVVANSNGNVLVCTGNYGNVYSFACQWIDSNNASCIMEYKLMSTGSTAKRIDGSTYSELTSTAPTSGVKFELFY